ncbi:hypothetical protein [Mucilaginibacter flavus]|uniref:hypothetical protein n=1 Tax=Mucilaginibacter flavus TaxID=931504 RepID=UPI0025B51D93|nr:hypothetical protein [Mucilaginibacter flavus]MDN3579251.1 hypothetical protein [Mucilaginibacter flavus]
MKNIPLLIIILLFAKKGFTQETIERSRQTSKHITEKLHVLKSDKSTRQGSCLVIYDKKYAIANGKYDHDVRVGIWHFFTSDGHLVQNYDYNSKEITYEAPEDTLSNLRYFVDKQLADSDKTTKPFKVGGRYYGYLPYLKLFKLPANLMDINRTVSWAVCELLVSPYGRLAYLKVTLYSGNYTKTFNMNIDLLAEEDKVFVPATVNNQPIGCRIMLKAYIEDDGTLGF